MWWIQENIIFILMLLFKNELWQMQILDVLGRKTFEKIKYQDIEVLKLL